MTSRHLVWDWNGTLLDDVQVVVDAVNAGLVAVGAGPIDVDGYRSAYTRPVRLFYERLMGRPLSDGDWKRVHDRYFESYLAFVGRAALTADALTALQLAARAGATQSLLSMAPHDHLSVIVEQHLLTGFFSEVQGTTDDRGGVKAASLSSHLSRLGIVSESVVVIGDTPDDAAAAAHVGARAVLYDGGSHHRHHLDGVGVPVAATLAEAVDLALSLSSRSG